jgi:hypothetical protein
MLANLFVEIDWVLFAAKLPLVIALVGLVNHLINWRCRVIIAKWADDNGWAIQTINRCYVRTGPFPWFPGMPVYRMTATDSAGRGREVYLRCGDPLLGVLSATVVSQNADLRTGRYAS